MNTSNLARRLDEFAATLEAVDAPEEKAPRMFAIVAQGLPRRPPRRLTLTTRRNQIRDPGLRQFRVL